MVVRFQTSRILLVQNLSGSLSPFRRDGSNHYSEFTSRCTDAIRTHRDAHLYLLVGNNDSPCFHYGENNLTETEQLLFPCDDTEINDHHSTYLGNPKYALVSSDGDSTISVPTSDSEREGTSWTRMINGKARRFKITNRSRMSTAERYRKRPSSFISKRRASDRSRSPLAYGKLSQRGDQYAVIIAASVSKSLMIPAFHIDDRWLYDSGCARDLV